METKIFLFLLLLCLPCRSQDNNLYVFDPRTLDENKILLSEIADDIAYIPLDNSFPLGEIHDNFRFTKNSIYFSVTYSGIFEFNRDGKFIRKIGSIGRGPGEYTFYSDFTIDNNKGIVYVLDNVNRKSPIKVYSRTGYFLKSISVPEYCENIQTIEFYNSKIFAFNWQMLLDTKYNWVVFDTLGNLITKKPRTIPMFMSGWSGSYGTYKYNNNLYYWDTYNDTVFSILPDFKYKGSFIISPGEHRAPRAHIPNPTLLKRYMLINHIFETSRFIVIRYFYKKMGIVLIDKRTKKSFLTYIEETNDNSYYSLGGFINNYDGGTIFGPRRFFVENGREYMIGLIYPYQIKARVVSSEFKNSTSKYPEKKKELEKLANRLKETDNPVLMIVRLKK